MSGTSGGTVTVAMAPKLMKSGVVATFAVVRNSVTVIQTDTIGLPFLEVSARYNGHE